jgi:hypothetical protein
VQKGDFGNVIRIASQVVVHWDGMAPGQEMQVALSSLMVAERPKKAAAKAAASQLSSAPIVEGGIPFVTRMPGAADACAAAMVENAVFQLHCAHAPLPEQLAIRVHVSDKGRSKTTFSLVARTAFPPGTLIFVPFPLSFGETGREKAGECVSVTLSCGGSSSVKYVKCPAAFEERPSAETAAGNVQVLYPFWDSYKASRVREDGQPGVGLTLEIAEVEIPYGAFNPKTPELRIKRAVSKVSLRVPYLVNKIDIPAGATIYAADIGVS